MTAYWHESFPDRLDDDYAGRPVPRRRLPAGATCVLTADGSPPDAGELATIEQFKRYLAARRAAGLGPGDPDTPETEWDNV
jgi:hypothetical protein